MIIDKQKMKAHGFVVEERDGMINIYPNPQTSTDEWFKGFRDIMKDEMPLRDAERLGDEFSAKATNQIIWNLMDQSLTLKDECYIITILKQNEEKIMMQFIGSNAILTVGMVAVIFSSMAVLYKGFKIMVGEIKV